MDSNTPQLLHITLDGPDKCGTPDEQEALISVLMQDFLRLPFTIWTIVTSWVECDIYHAFQPQDDILTYELDITTSINYADIVVFFNHHLAVIHTKNSHSLLKPGWAGVEVFDHLVESASGLFIWAWFTSEFINGHNPRQQLDALLTGNAALSSFDAALDTVYCMTLESVG
jgi:hypothetical protein